MIVKQLRSVDAMRQKLHTYTNIITLKCQEMTKVARNTKISKFSAPLQEILRELCKRVGADPEKLDFGPKETSNEEWYTLYEWTEEDEQSFTEWLEGYVYKNARRMGIPKNKTYVKRCVAWFGLFTWNTKKSGDNLK